SAHARRSGRHLGAAASWHRRATDRARTIRERCLRAVYRCGSGGASAARPARARGADGGRRGGPRRGYGRSILHPDLAGHWDRRGGCRVCGCRVDAPTPSRPFCSGSAGWLADARATRGGLVIYRRRVSPLHAVRAGVAVSYCLALALAALLASNPLELAAVTAAILGAGVAARVGSALRTALIVAIPMGIAIALVNALLTRDGLTVIARLGD